MLAASHGAKKYPQSSHQLSKKQTTTEGMAVSPNEISALQALEKSEQRNAELIHVNNQWDIDYTDMDEAFKQYRFDSKQAQASKQAVIDKLKRHRDELIHEVKSLKEELTKSHHKIRTLQRGDHAQRIRELEDELSLQRQQLKTYQEDFEAERRDRVRLGDEKQSAALRYEADITSLKLQLDRCRHELARYTTEASRLAQQLKLKQQYEDDQYRKHLDSRGYVSRCPNGKLPPLDPFVEIDEDSPVAPPSNRGGGQLCPTHYQNGHVMHNGHSVAQSTVPTRRVSPPMQYSSGTSHEAVMRRSATANNAPAGLLARGEFPPTTATSSSPIISRGSATPSPVNIAPTSSGYNPVVNAQNHASTKLAVQQNGVPQRSGLQVGAQHNGAVMNGYTPYATIPGQHDDYSSFVEVLDTDSSAPVVKTVTNKGKHKCQRCALRFTTNSELVVHKSRCIS